MVVWLKRALLTVVLIAALPSAYVIVVLMQARGGLPVWDGEYELAGPQAEIEILRDRHGVPHIFVESETDAHFALGFVHAQDRLWQMMFDRQRLQGRLAEWMGTLALDADIIQRELIYPPHVAAQQWDALPAETRRFLQAYADGVNAYLDSDAFELPPEMRILHVRPEPWRPEDALVVWSQLYAALITPGSESARQRLSLYAQADHAAQLEELEGEGVPIVELWPGGSEASEATMRDRGSGTTLPMPVSSSNESAFSNGWTVSGAHTVSGKPLLANDPHLASRAPNLWYLAHQSIGGRAVVGASIPGIPGVIVGRTDGLAWGATNAVLDASDYSLVEGRGADSTLYRTAPDAPWQRFDSYEQTYRVRFGRDVVRPLRAVGRSMVFPDDRSTAPMAPDGAITLVRSVGWERDHSLTAVLALNRAQTVEEGRAAGRRLLAPAINLSLADTRGRIGYVMAGRIPSRSPQHARFVDFAPKDHNDWGGLIPANENPWIIDPPSGRIVSANQLIVGDAYPHYLSDFWVEPYRAKRIHRMLDDRPRHDVAGFIAMQSDTLSPPAVAMLPALVTVAPADPSDQRLIDLLAAWDGRFELDSAAPVVYLAWLVNFQRQTIEDELGPVLAPRYRPFLMMPLLQRILAGDKAHWCDDVTTTPVRESCADILLASLSDAHRDLVEAFGPEPSGWTWREAADFTHAHLGFAGLPVLGRWFSRFSEVGGGPESAFIHQVLAEDAPRFDAHLFASSLQVVFDLDDPDNSRYVISGGQSGHFRSPHYDDLLALWERGERIRIPTRRSSIERTARLALIPVN